MTEDQKAFEAWMSNNGEYPKAIAKNNDGLYSLMQTFIQGDKMNRYIGLINGKIETLVFIAESLNDAQVQMLRYYSDYCDQANIIAMTEQFAKEIK